MRELIQFLSICFIDNRPKAKQIKWVKSDPVSAAFFLKITQHSRESKYQSSHSFYLIILQDICNLPVLTEVHIPLYARVTRRPRFPGTVPVFNYLSPATAVPGFHCDWKIRNKNFGMKKRKMLTERLQCSLLLSHSHRLQAEQAPIRVAC